MSEPGDPSTGENHLRLANQPPNANTLELAQLRAQIGRIAAEFGVPINSKHAQVAFPPLPLC